MYTTVNLIIHRNIHSYIHKKLNIIIVPNIPTFMYKIMNLIVLPNIPPLQRIINAIEMFPSCSCTFLLHFLGISSYID